MTTIGFFALPITNHAYALDPFSVGVSGLAHGFSGGGKTVLGVVDGLDKMEEAANLGFSLTDLLSDLGANTDQEELEIQSATNRLSNLRSWLHELGSTTKEAEYLLSADINQTKSLSEKIRHLRSLISASKKIAAIAGIRPKAAEKAVRIQEIRINSMILEELQSIHRLMFLKNLNEHEVITKQNLLAHEIRSQETRKSFSQPPAQSRAK